jgi:hypothetical protein
VSGEKKGRRDNMAKFKKKPVVIEAVQWNGKNHREMYNFLTGDVDG